VGRSAHFAPQVVIVQSTNAERQTCGDVPQLQLRESSPKGSRIRFPITCSDACMRRGADVHISILDFLHLPRVTGHRCNSVEATPEAGAFRDSRELDSHCRA
jgi:hypothetical protein